VKEFFSGIGKVNCSYGKFFTIEPLAKLFINVVHQYIATNKLIIFSDMTK